MHPVTMDLNHHSGHRIAPLIEPGGAPLKCESRYQDQNDACERRFASEDKSSDHRLATMSRHASPLSRHLELNI
jgi:hypothetical protein